MRTFFSKHGVATTSALLAGFLEVHAASPSPAGLASAVASQSLAGASVAGAAGGGLGGSLRAWFASKASLTLVAALALSVLVLVLVEIRIGGVIDLGKRARTKAQLAQWTIAMQSYKSDYGHYPRVDAATADGQGTNHVIADRFAIALTGRHLNGDALVAGEDDVGNTKGRTYYAFSQDEMDLESNPPKLRDAFGNADIAVLYDTNGDGFINTSDVPAPPTLKAADGASFTPGPKDVDLKVGIRAGVLFCTPGDGHGAVFSWK